MYRLISAQPLIAPSIWEFCISSVLSVSIAGSVLSILTQFLSNRSQQVMVAGCRSKLVNVVSGVSQSSVLGSLLFLLYTSDLFSILGNKVINQLCCSLHLIAVVPAPGIRVTVTESLSCDVMKVSEWYVLWEMKLSASKTKSMIISKSHTMHPQSPTLTIGGTVLMESDDIVILEVTIEFKMTFEKHPCSVSRAAFQWLDFLRKSWQVFDDRLLLVRCFVCFIRTFLEYCSTVWCSADDMHLQLLDRVVSGANFF